MKGAVIMKFLPCEFVYVVFFGGVGTIWSGSKSVIEAKSLEHYFILFFLFLMPLTHPAYRGPGSAWITTI